MVINRNNEIGPLTFQLLDFTVNRVSAKPFKTSYGTEMLSDFFATELQLGKIFCIDIMSVACEFVPLWCFQPARV